MLSFKWILENNSILNIKCLNHTVSPNPPTLHPFQGKTTLCSLNCTSWTTTLLSCSTFALASSSKGSTGHMLSQLEPLPGILGFRENISCWNLNMKLRSCQMPCQFPFRRKTSIVEEKGIKPVIGREQKRRENPVSNWDSALFFPLFQFCVKSLFWFLEPINFYFSSIWVGVY